MGDGTGETRTAGEPEEEAGARRQAPESGDQARSFREVLRAELDTIRESRKLRGQPAGEGADEGSGPADDPIGRAHRAHLTGFSISGGGIRSATFNLGVIQGLARLGLLPRLDYLSVNSGGGYIGSWLAAWIRRRGLTRVVDELASDACRDDAPATGASGVGHPPGHPPHHPPAGQAGSVHEGQEVEAEPVRFLRRFSNYLTPQVGALSADTWTMVSTYLRNLFLNQAVVVLALGTLLLLPRILLLLSKTLGAEIGPASSPSKAGLYGLIGTAILCLGFGLGWILVNVARIGRATPSPEGEEPPFYTRQIGVQILVVVPLFAAAWLAAQWLWFARAGALATDGEGLALSDWLSHYWSPWRGVVGRLGQETAELLTWAFLAAVVYTVAWLLATVILFLVDRLRGPAEGTLDPEGAHERLWIALVASAPFAGAVGGALLWTLTLVSRGLERLFEAAAYEQPWHLLHVNVWKAPAIIVVCMLTAFVQTGLMGRTFPERLREWWSRLGAWMLIYSVTWLAFFGIAIYGPIALVVLGSLAVSGLSAGWLATTIAGVRLGGKARPSPGNRGGAGADSRPLWQRLVISFAPQIFMIGLLALVGLGLHAVLSPPSGDGLPADRSLSAGCGFFWPPAEDAERSDAARAREVVDCHSERLFEGTTPWATSLLLLGLGLGAVGLSARVDVNEFSMHLFYRNRLIRAYLGASNPDRRPQPFTGFDPDDDVALADMVPEKGYDGPYPIHNATLNLVAGHELAWQERKGASWVFTPRVSGFDVYAGQASRTLAAHGYRPTGRYEQTSRGLTTGTAMGISGAAVSPNMGPGTTPAMAFLLTVFNVRLGWWLGNSRHRKSWREMGPRVGLFSLVSELFGHTDERSRYVYLSDGGHFDNLGLYELVRRRCRFIVATDAGEDADLTFSGLGNAVRKCCTDFGVDIRIQTSEIRRDPETGASRWHCAVGTIDYGRVDRDAAPGVLVYLKASLTGDEPIDTQAYAALNPGFPNQSTADQWFDESQFESYRKLGEHVALDVLGAALDAPPDLPVEDLCALLVGPWQATSPSRRDRATGP